MLQRIAPMLSQVAAQYLKSGLERYAKMVVRANVMLDWQGCVWVCVRVDVFKRPLAIG